MEAGELSKMLARDAYGVAKYLLPNGKKEGAEFRVGSIAGEPGKSLSIKITGSKTGIWCDFAEGGTGDLLDLWAAVRCLNTATAMKEAKDYLGVREPKLRGYIPQKNYKRPQKPKCSPLKPTSDVTQYLVEERGLSLDTIRIFKLGERGQQIIFPFLRDHELIMVKYRALKLNNQKKDTRPTSDHQEPILFGWQSISPTARSVTIVEGEIDAMTAFQYGHPALSVPFGGGGGRKQDWIINEYEHLERFDEIFICMDMDPEGQKAAEEIIDRLGRHRCCLVELPYKDMNECLQKNVAKPLIDEAFNNAETLDPEELHNAQEYVDEVKKRFYPPEGERIGYELPWKKIADKLLMRPGELTIVAGYNGHGKSQGAGHISLHIMHQGGKVCIASLEFKPPVWLERLTRQAAALNKPSIEYIDAIHDWYSDKLWVFDLVGRTKVERLLTVFEYARKRYGIDFFLIDNLSKCGVDMENFEEQRDFIDKLTDFAKVHNAHVVLVAHTRKGRDDFEMAGKMDVKGSGAITDLADTVLMWWRNRKKEQDIKKQADSSAILDDELTSKPDARVKCEKQRNGEDEPTIYLWFDKDSFQFLEYSRQKPFRYVEYSRLPENRDAC